MALRNILTQEDPSLGKKCREVTAFNQRLHQLLDDMAETLMHADGVGLAAPQVGVLRRAALVLETNVPENENPILIELINPVVIEASGEQHQAEGCLSVPGRQGVVTRPKQIKVRYQNRKGEWMELSTEGFEARAICHELDHLDGVLYKDKVNGELYKVEPADDEDYEEEEDEE